MTDSRLLQAGKPNADTVQNIPNLRLIKASLGLDSGNYLLAQCVMRLFVKQINSILSSCFHLYVLTSGFRGDTSKWQWRSAITIQVLNSTLSYPISSCVIVDQWYYVRISYTFLNLQTLYHTLVLLLRCQLYFLHYYFVFALSMYQNCLVWI